MKKCILAFISICVLFSPILQAQEPANLGIAKQAIVKYYLSGEYQKDISHTIDQAKAYLEKRLSEVAAEDKPAIVLDIDETSLSNYDHLLKEDFGGRREEIIKMEMEADDPPIIPTLELYRYAKANHVAVFFITGRQEAEREATITNLNKAGYSHWDGLVLRNKQDQGKPAAVFKTAIRKQLVEQGYHIILNIGDQQSDLEGAYAEKAFKLPGPFYYIS